MVRLPDPTGTLRAVETRLRTSIDRVASSLELEVSAPQPVELVVTLPRHRFDPLNQTPVLEGWEPGPHIAVSGTGAGVRVKVPANAFRGSATVTPFTLVDGRYTSWKLDRQIEQMLVLEGLHPERGFGARAQQWSVFRDAWAARSAS
jgi:hypothetical protein